MQVTGLDHLQLGIPAGAEDRARGFYIGALGFEERARPAPVSADGLWLESGSLRLRLAVQPDFRAADSSHPSLRVTGLREVTRLCREAGGRVVPDETARGMLRAWVFDPFGNRIELLETGVST
jgi:catechol 2,3-dioxygenase-like lactoylglutathione lyase family enzyme